MNHKRRRPKNRRSGCLMCKPWKVNGTSKAKKMRAGEKRRNGIGEDGKYHVYLEKMPTPITGVAVLMEELERLEKKR